MALRAFQLLKGKYSSPVDSFSTFSFVFRAVFAGKGVMGWKGEAQDRRKRFADERVNFTDGIL